MKRLYVMALIATLGMTGTGAISAQAAVNCENMQMKAYVINAGEAGCTEDMKNVLAQLCGNFCFLNWNACPETEAPEVNVPETETPETETPETNAPETNAPETEAPETNAPETEAPETNAPETNAPETETPETEVTELSFAEQVVALVNEERTKAGLSELSMDQDIASAALIRAQEIEVSFSHTRPDGRSFSTVLTDNGITFRGSGENIAWGQQTPEAVMNAWMNSDGHRANILNPNFKKIGVGYYQNAAGRKFWTQLFTY